MSRGPPSDPGRASHGTSRGPPSRSRPSQPRTSRGPAEPLADEPVRADTTGPAPLPIANYDDVSLASLRARLRNLDSAQLQALLSYEQAHAARPAVLGMFERRISKLETGQG